MEGINLFLILNVSHANSFNCCLDTVIIIHRDCIFNFSLLGNECLYATHNTSHMHYYMMWT